jgi:hypothetical protein
MPGPNLDLQAAVASTVAEVLSGPRGGDPRNVLQSLRRIFKPGGIASCEQSMYDYMARFGREEDFLLEDQDDVDYYTTTDEADQLSKTPVSIYSVLVVAMVIIDVFLV